MNKNLFGTIFSQKNLDEHVSTKWKKITFRRGVWGAEAEEILKNNQTKWRLFLYFFAFGQGSLDPQKYELAP